MKYHLLIALFGLISASSVTAQNASPKAIIDKHCPPGKQALGPAMIVGRVQNSDSGIVASGATVTLAWQEVKADSISGVRSEPRVRRANVDANGNYYICGLSPNLDAIIMAEKGALRSLDTKINIDGELLTVRDISISRADAIKEKSRINTLPTVTVKEKYVKGLANVGFTRRKRQGLGNYITRDYVEKRSPVRFTDIFRSTHGVRTVSHGLSYGLTSTRSFGKSGGCMNYYVDGVKQARVEPGDLDNMIKPENVAAIEIYHGSNTPQEFQSSGSTGCTTMVVWTTFKVRDVK